MISIPLILTDEHECSYLTKENAKTAFVHPAFPIDNQLYSKLITQGYRRSGNELYSPYCAKCQQCVSVRIPIRQFNPNRRQRRCKQKHNATTTIIKTASFDQRHYDLYLKYQKHRHAGGVMAESTEEDYFNFLSSSWCQTAFVEFHSGDALFAVATIDLLQNSLSAVYTFFDPDFAHLSPGVYAILWQISYAQQMNLDFLYLGYWIEQCPKMTYKTQYQPIEGYFDHQWQQIKL